MLLLLVAVCWLLYQNAVIQNTTRQDNSAIRNHCRNSDPLFKVDNFTVLDSNSYEKGLQHLESIHIKTCKPEINAMQMAFTLNILE